MVVIFCLFLSFYPINMDLYHLIDFRTKLIFFNKIIIQGKISK